MGVGLTQSRALQARRSSSRRGKASKVVGDQFLGDYSGSICFNNKYNCYKGKMRKTVLYWEENQIVFLEKERQRLKALQATYNEIVLSPSVPSSFNPRFDYIRLTNSDAFPVSHRNLISTLVYCLKLNENKKHQIQYRFRFEGISVAITNEFNDLVKKILLALGYDEEKKIQKEEEQVEIPSQNRFLLDQKQNRPEEEFIRQSYLKKESGYLSKLFTLDHDIEKVPLNSTKKGLERQLKEFMKDKDMLILEKEFKRIHQANSLQELCRACLYFYSLEKYPLYRHLNLILKNIRSVTFEKQFQKLKLFAYLLILNYFFVYFHNDTDIPHILYRFTNAPIDEHLVGQVITVPSFYSVSELEVEEFKNKTSKLIIYPLAESNQISLRSVFPIHEFSAFRKEKQYLFIPFTSFKILAVKKAKEQQVVYLKEVLGNTFITSILNSNFQIASSKSVLDQELMFQLRYENSQQIVRKMKVLFNLGLIHYKYSEKYSLAKQYFKEAIECGQKLKNNVKLSKFYNYLALAYGKLSHPKEAQYYFEKSHQILIQLPKSDKNNYRIASLYNNEGSILESETNFSRAVKKYEEAKQILQSCKLKNNLMEACISNNIGRCKMELEFTFSEIYVIFQKAICTYKEIYGDNENIPELVPIYENISQLFQRNKEIHKSIKNQEQAIEIYRSGNEVDEEQSISLLFMKLRLAKLCMQLQSYDKSIQIYEEGLKTSLLVNDKGRTWVSIKSNIASAYISKGSIEDFKKGIKCYEQAIQYLRQPFLAENECLYNKICDMKNQLEECLAVYEN